MKALKSIFCLSKLMWLPLRCRAFSYLLTILQILLICSLVLVLSPKLSQVIFHLDLMLLMYFHSEFPFVYLSLRYMAFSRISFHMIISTLIENIFSNSLKLRNYRWYILCTRIGSSVISVAINVIILTFKKQVNQVNVKQ